MSDSPQPPAAPNWGPTPPAPPGWTPAPNQNWPPPGPGTWAPPHTPFFSRPGAYESLSRWAKLLGLVLVFVGVFAAVLFASVPGNCYTTGANCSASGTGFPAQYAWAVLVAKALVVLGLSALALGAFLKMRTDMMPANGRREDLDFVLADRRWNWVLFLLMVLLLMVVLFTVNSAPAGSSPVVIP